MRLFCQPMGLVCMRADAASDLAEWIAAARTWMLAASARCGLMPSLDPRGKAGSFGE